MKHNQEHFAHDLPFSEFIKQLLIADKYKDKLLAKNRKCRAHRIATREYCLGEGADAIQLDSHDALMNSSLVVLHHLYVSAQVQLTTTDAVDRRRNPQTGFNVLGGSEDRRRRPHVISRETQGHEHQEMTTSHCTCGWKSKPVGAYNSYQNTILAEQEDKHLSGPALPPHGE